MSREIAIRGDTIRLGQLLKLAGIVGAGGELKAFLAEADVRVNGEPDARRGRQLHPGDTVSVGGRGAGDRPPLDSPARMPPGETTTGPPDFVGVGTQRSGTTWWFETLLDHPQIRGPRTGRKEQHFFDQFATRELTDERIARYHKQFPRGPGQIVGEWTPRYMHDFWVPPLIRRAAPGAKLLIMFRDPIERYRSGVPHRASRSADPRMEAVCADAAERGRYAAQLKRVLAVHDRETNLYPASSMVPGPEDPPPVRFSSSTTRLASAIS